jgi:hypothetical protein
MCQLKSGPEGLRRCLPQKSAGRSRGNGEQTESNAKLSIKEEEEIHNSFKRENMLSVSRQTPSMYVIQYGTNSLIASMEGRRFI